jgi:hypothetical protein
MIDRASRRQLAELLRQLVTGQITNDQFEDRIPYQSHDPSIREICREGAWFLYDDLHEHRLVGKFRLDKEQRSEIARWILFLERDSEYEWPIMPAWKRIALIVACLATFGLLAAIMRRINRENPDLAVWPFRNVAAYQAALQNPPYLNGAA